MRSAANKWCVVCKYLLVSDHISADSDVERMFPKMTESATDVMVKLFKSLLSSQNQVQNHRWAISGNGRLEASGTSEPTSETRHVIQTFPLPSLLSIKPTAYKARKEVQVSDREGQKKARNILGSRKQKIIDFQVAATRWLGIILS